MFICTRSAPVALALAALLGALAPACSTPPPPEAELPSAEGYYKEGLEVLDGYRVLIFFRDVNYPLAIRYFQEVIDNYPYSQYATLAELKIADIQFDRGSYEEAASYYQDFVELHPRHEQVSYAIYRSALCAFEGIRAADRDQEPTRQAVAQFRALLEQFPRARSAEDARDRLDVAESRLAEAEVMVGDFYFRRGEYHAAINRYRNSLTNFPDHDGRLETMAQLGSALLLTRQLYQAESVLRTVLASEPEPALRDRVEYDLVQIAEDPGFGARPLLRSCITDPNPACQDVRP